MEQKAEEELVLFFPASLIYLGDLISSSALGLGADCILEALGSHVRKRGALDGAVL